MRNLAKFGGISPSFLLGALSGNQHNIASSGAEATSCRKVSRMSVDRHHRKWVDRWKKETCAKHKIAITEWII